MQIILFGVIGIMKKDISPKVHHYIVLGQSIRRLWRFASIPNEENEFQPPIIFNLIEILKIKYKFHILKFPISHKVLEEMFGEFA